LGIEIVDLFVAAMSTTGDRPLTVIDSARLATRNSTLTVAVKPRTTRMSSRAIVSKPLSS
jgi:hypothetical protein